MDMAFESLLLGSSILLILSIVASKASSWLGIPALLLFLGIGMFAGSEGPGGIYFDNAAFAQSLGVIALAFILFSGGLDTEWRTIRPVLWSGLSLANFGVLISGILVGLFATFVLDLPWMIGLLLGVIVSSTDAAAVFAVMRARGVNLKENLEPLIELESGSNDPIAVFLTIGLTNLLVTSGTSLVGLIPGFVLQMTLGAALGYTMGLGMTFIVNRSRLPYDGLYPALMVGMVLFTYSMTDAVGGNGFLAVYIAGMVMGNRNFIHKRSLMRFHDAIAWCMQIAMFITLGLLIFPSQLIPVIGSGILVSLFLIFVARPISVFIALALTKLSFRAKSMVAWVGLRGAVPIVLATFPLLADVPQSDVIFNLVFFIVITSVLLQGSSIGLVARLLNMNNPKEALYHYPMEFVPDVNINSQLVELAIPGDSPVVGKSIMELRLPKGALIVMVSRNSDKIVPDGGTVLESEDTLLVLTDGESLTDMRSFLEVREQPVSSVT